MKQVDKSLHFRWTPKRVRVAHDLAEGFTRIETSERNQISRQAIWKWQNDPEFASEVERLTVMVGIAIKAERLRIIKRAVRQQMQGEIKTKHDLLDWLKFAKSETDGIKLNLTSELQKAIQNYAGMFPMP